MKRSLLKKYAVAHWNSDGIKKGRTNGTKRKHRANRRQAKNRMIKDLEKE